MAYQNFPRRNPNRQNRWQDGANIVLAIWLFISPWVLQFGSSTVVTQPAAAGVAVNAVSNAAWNAWVLGVLVFLVAISALGRMELWQEWCNLVLGAWVFIAPWVLGFATGNFPAAAWDHWIVGALIFIVSVSSLSTASAPPLDTGMGSVPPRDVGVQPPQNPVGGPTTRPTTTTRPGEPTRPREPTDHR